MATTVPKLSSSGAVKIRFSSMDQGTTRWREGTFEILEKDNKVNLCLRFNCGGASKTFQVWITFLNFNLFNNCEVCCFFHCNIHELTLIVGDICLIYRNLFTAIFGVSPFFI